MDPNKYFNIEETKGTVKKYEDYMKGKDVSDNNIKVQNAFDILK